VTQVITRERAERIARAHACERCGEYTFKKFAIRVAPESQREALNVAWIARKTCGVCGVEQEVGLDAEGDIVFAG
jgi:transcription elongation factor Elf1